MSHFLEIMYFFMIYCIVDISMKIQTFKFPESLITNIGSNCKIQNDRFNTSDQNCQKKKIIQRANLVLEVFGVADSKYKVKITKFKIMDSIQQAKMTKKIINLRQIQHTRFFRVADDEYKDRF